MSSQAPQGAFGNRGGPAHRIFAGSKSNMQRQPLSANPRVVERSNLMLKNRKMMCTPRSDMIANIGMKSLISSTYQTSGQTKLEELPDLAGVPPDQFNGVIQKKLKACCTICSFTAQKDEANRAKKTKYLTEIFEHLSQGRYFQLCDSATFDALFEMIKANILRTLPPIPALAKAPLLGDDIKDTFVEAAWPHLDIVYQIFMKFLESPQMVAAQHIKRFDDTFLVRFFQLFDSGDARERDALKNVLHRMYLKFNQLRPRMRQIMQEIFFTFLYETKYFNGINELLEFYISIVNGFTVPIKKENIQFLMRILMPLHTSDYFHMFQENLFFCVMVFVEKDPSLIPAILKKLIAYWPSSLVKALLFLAEIATLIDQMSDEQFNSGVLDLFRFIGRCVESENFQVCEAAIMLWKSDDFVMKTAQNACRTFPIIVPSLYRTCTYHWNTQIRNIAVSVLRVCMQTAPPIYEQVSKGVKEIEQVMANTVQKEKELWSQIIAQAQANDADVKVIEKPRPFDDVFSGFR